MNERTLPTVLERRRAAREMLIEEVDLKFSNGAERTFTRLLPQGRGAVMIIAVDDDDQVLLTREYACGLHGYTLGLPRGRIDADEDVLVAAQRELMEEAGVGAHRLDRLRKLALAPNYMAHEIDVVLARDLYPAQAEGDEPEPIEVQRWPLSDIETLALNPEFHEGRALGALLLARAWLEQNP
jgi:ADP-ribose diphosphatase